MRMFIAAGLGSVTLDASAFTMAFAAPAQAAPLIRGICESVPNLLATVNATLGVANTAVSTAQSALTTKQAALADALSEYVDAGTGVALPESILNARIADVGAKAADWSNARVALWNADNQAFAPYQRRRGQPGGVRPLRPGTSRIERPRPLRDSAPHSVCVAERTSRGALSRAGCYCVRPRRLLLRSA